MYQTHNAFWFLGSFIVLLVVLLISAVLRQRMRWPGWIVPVVAVVAALQLVGALVLRGYDEKKLREELQQLPHEAVSRLVISRAGSNHIITKREGISQLLTLVQSLTKVAAHHSYPVGICDLAIERGADRFRYLIGRDSATAGEYWIMEKARPGGGDTGREIGRVQTAQIEPLIERLIRDAPAGPQ